MNTLTFAEAVAACAAGKTVEYSYDGGSTWHRKVLDSSWFHRVELYRLAESPIAPGHNPEKLTEEVVGVVDGWRLLTEEESKPSRRVPETEGWFDGRWRSLPSGNLGWWCWWCGPDVTLRTKKPPGYFLPKPKRTVPCKGLEDYPSGTLVQRKDGSSAIYEIIGWHSSGVNIFWSFRSWDDLACYWLRSLDGGRTWIQCCKEVEG